MIYNESYTTKAKRITLTKTEVITAVHKTTAKNLIMVKMEKYL